MATDTQWPSEDEDFDAVVDSKNAKTKTATERKSVSVVSDDEAPKKDSIRLEVQSDSVDEDAELKPDEDAASDTELDSEQAAKPEAEVTPSESAKSHAPTSSPTPPTAPIRTSLSSDTKTPVGRLFLEVLLVMALAGVGFWALTLSSHNKELEQDKKSLKQQVEQLNANPQIAVQKQTDDLISKVGALMQLPTGETPTVANVSDAAAAKKQSAFFNNAQNGDKVLMYVKAGEAVLYRPSTNKIILVAPLTFSGSATASTPVAKPKP